jgi:HEAT repeat protein
MNATLVSIESDIASLVDHLDSKNPVEREQSREALVDAGRAAIIPVLQKLKQGGQRSSWEAAKILGAIGDPAAASALVELLDHEDHDIRWVAAESLAALGCDGLKQVLMALLSKADSVWLQESAHHVIASFAKQRSGEFLKPLLTAFEAFQPAVALPINAFRALHELNHIAPHFFPPHIRRQE